MAGFKEVIAKKVDRAREIAVEKGLGPNTLVLLAFDLVDKIYDKAVIKYSGSLQRARDFSVTEEVLREEGIPVEPSLEYLKTLADDDFSIILFFDYDPPDDEDEEEGGKPDPQEVF